MAIYPLVLIDNAQHGSNDEKHFRASLLATSRLASLGVVVYATSHYTLFQSCSWQFLEADP